MTREEIRILKELLQNIDSTLMSLCSSPDDKNWSKIYLLGVKVSQAYSMVSNAYKEIEENANQDQAESEK